MTLVQVASTSSPIRMKLELRTTTVYKSFFFLNNLHGAPEKLYIMVQHDLGRLFINMISLHFYTHIINVYVYATVLLSYFNMICRKTSF